MSQRYSVGDHVSWTSGAGQLSGHVTKVHTSGFTYKGHNRRASGDEPQHEIASDKTDHKHSALNLMKD